MAAWEVVEEAGSAGELHGDGLPVPDRRLVRVAAVRGPALVLGSAQVAAHLDHGLAADLGVEVARRRSGGGAVLIWPGHQVWLDVCLPRSDPLWDDDVGRSARWLGDSLAAALLGLGAAGAAAHAGPMEHTAWSHQVCFAGRAPGEVVVAGRKVVGTSQRRTRPGAVFQVTVALVWAPRILVDVLRLPEEAGLAVATAGLGLGELVPGVRAAAVVEAVVSALPR
jgi:lipoate-protein ligase A